MLVPQARLQELELSLNDDATPGMTTPFPTGFAAWPAFEHGGCFVENVGGFLANLIGLASNGRLVKPD